MRSDHWLFYCSTILFIYISNGGGEEGWGLVKKALMISICITNKLNKSLSALQKSVPVIIKMKLSWGLRVGLWARLTELSAGWEQNCQLMAVYLSGQPAGFLVCFSCSYLLGSNRPGKMPELNQKLLFADKAFQILLLTFIIHFARCPQTNCKML